MKSEELYSAEWFKKRALNAIRPLEQGSWDYSDSLLLYLPGSDYTYETVQEIDTPYHKLVTAPEREYLKEIAPTLVKELPDHFEYIDLGPGTEHKEQFVFDAVKEQGKNLLYQPIDISDRYLALSSEYATTQGFEVSPLKASFEELDEMLGTETAPRFVSIGLTYGNYNSSEILNLLRKLIGKQGSAFINAQIGDRADMEAIRTIYAGVAESMVAAKIELLGLNPEEDISEIEVTDEVKVWYTLKQTSSELESRGIKVGDRLLVLQSLRPTVESLTNDISAVFPMYQMFDTGKTFIGVLLK